MAVSNAVGSNVFDILICMGLPWLIKSIISQAPIVIYSRGLLYSTLTLFTTVIYLLVATHINRWRLTKIYGYALLIGYIIVLVFCSLYELNYFGTVRDIMWCRRDIRLSTKGWVYCAAVCFVLLYGGETWPVRVEDICRLLVFDHRCLRNIARISWDHRVINTIVRKRVLGKDGKSIDEVVKLHQLRWRR
ncbi:unnamed protein product [Schistosoma curassoni]|uniref:Na_Ca_ex domain-containing protein n=1 Tax=Schistosoma curassoni TaxID=6186 RepID=A0A183KGP3_9TREM|nr:unnamed protein product [Schistosoma curassoni]